VDRSAISIPFAPYPSDALKMGWATDLYVKQAKSVLTNGNDRGYHANDPERAQETRWRFKRK
jgi:hypothetical protein